MHPLILMYHSVTTGYPADLYTVSIKSLEDHIRWFQHHGFRFVPLKALVESGRLVEPDTAGQVALTFDDGYRDFAECALPLLVRHGLPATVFLVTDRVGQCSNWKGEGQDLPLMTPAQIQEVRAAGISLGSHTLSHVDLTAIASRAELQRQVVESQKALAGFGEEFPSFSYPWGRYARREVQAVKVAGYKCAVGIDEPAFFHTDRLFRMSRLPMRRDIDVPSLAALVAGMPLRQRIAIQARHLLRAVLS